MQRICTNRLGGPMLPRNTERTSGPTVDTAPNEMEDGVVLSGPQFSEPMRVIGSPAVGDGFISANLVGIRTNAFRGGVTLTAKDLESVCVERPDLAFGGKPRLFKLGLEALRISFAQEYDPYFGLSISRVDPLPHQLDAVYNHLLRSARCRFLLADDAGAGKTIMAGLLLKELKLRGLVERVLIVCPANLAFQWQREMTDRFQESFRILQGADLRVQYGVNMWNEHPQIITSMDLAKREEILPSVKQADDWDLILIDEAHRLSARDAEHKSERYRLGELLRDKSAHILLLTATPHKGDPVNFSLFMQLLDQDAFADVQSIHDAIDVGESACYLRRTKEVMVHFPKAQPDGTWRAAKLFTKRIPHTVAFDLEGEEFALYKAVTSYVQRQSAKAESCGDDRRARAVGFIMAMYQRRMASSVHSLLRSLLRREKNLKSLLETATRLGDLPMPDVPSEEDWEEMDDAEREAREKELERATLARRKPDLEAELVELHALIEQAQKVEAGGNELKLRRLREQMTESGFFPACRDAALSGAGRADPNQRLLIFTEYKDTLDYLVKKLREWKLTVGCIHGSMKPGSRDEEGTRLNAERNFWDLKTQVLVATEAAGEGINLQCCNFLFNYDIPWNPNRLEQRMGRIHRYGQTKDCLIFNFFARNTVEGRVLQKLLDKLQAIRDALDDDAVFNVVGEVLPANQIERLLRDFYAGKLSGNDIEARIEVEVREDEFRNICESALEGLARKSLNLPMLVERRALAQERRIVPETVCRFFETSSREIGLPLTPLRDVERAFTVGRIPAVLYEEARAEDWRLPELARRYERVCFDRDSLKADARLEWVTPGHPLFEAVRRRIWEMTQGQLRQGAVFYTLQQDQPSVMELFVASVVDGTGDILHRRLFVVETGSDLPAPRPGTNCVYVLRCKDESFYVGQTDDLPRRMQDHEDGRVSWTMSRLPCELIHYESFANREEAVKREQDLKTGFGRKWLKREYAEGRLAARQAGGTRRLRDPACILDLIVPERPPQIMPTVTTDDQKTRDFLFQQGLVPFQSEVGGERAHELDLIERSVKACFEVLIRKRDEVLNRHLLAQERGDASAVGLAENEAQKVQELQRRRDLRLRELARQRSLSLQGVERLGIVLAMPHPDRDTPAVAGMKPDRETERKAVETVIAYEKARGCTIEDVQTANLGFDLRSLHPQTGENRLIEVKGIGAATGTICLSPNEKRVAEDRPDLYWLYVVTNCDTQPELQEPIQNPARYPWHEVKKVEHYRLDVNALTKPMVLREDRSPYGGQSV
jgi:superfamily II DNA or RNA helicase/predicted GIY-YIG superfamily endonuclease